MRLLGSFRGLAWVYRIYQRQPGFLGVSPKGKKKKNQDPDRVSRVWSLWKEAFESGVVVGSGQEGTRPGSAAVLGVYVALLLTCLAHPRDGSCVYSRGSAFCGGAFNL